MISAAILIANGVAPFIDGRTELYGEKFFVDHNAASGLMEPDNLFRLLQQYEIEATLMRTQSAATKLLDHVDGWQKSIPTTSRPFTCARWVRCTPWSLRSIRRRSKPTASDCHRNADARIGDARAALCPLLCQNKSI